MGELEYVREEKETYHGHQKTTRNDWIEMIIQSLILIILQTKT